MKFEVHTKGQPSAETLLGSADTYGDALAMFGYFEAHGTACKRGPWAIVPAGRADELGELGNLRSILPNSALYVLNCAGGVSTLGFDYAERQRAGALEWAASLGEPVPAASTAERGSPESYLDYLAAMEIGAQAAKRHPRERCPMNLTPELVGLEGKWVEVISPDGERDRFKVGRSTGWAPCHLALEREESEGGCSAYIPEGARVEVLA